MDTLFSKEKYIVGNKCAHIVADGEFVQIIPMRSKSEAGMKLDSINQEIRVANEILWMMHLIILVTVQKQREWQGWE